MYYLGSRYYDSVVKRFISPDDIGVILASPYGLIDKNLYSYCDNNPVMRVDHGGKFWDFVLDVVSIVLGACDLIEDPSWEKAGLLAVDVALTVVPFVPSVSGARHLGKVDDVVDVASTINKMDNVGDAVKLGNNANDFGKVIVQYGDEIKLSNQIKSSDAIDVWNKFLGENQTNYNRFTGINEMDRIFSADVTRSIRFGNHEMRSVGTTKAHFHYEVWRFNPNNNTVHVKNILQRLK